MKRILLILTCLFFTNSIFSQEETSNWQIAVLYENGEFGRLNESDFNAQSSWLYAFTTREHKKIGLSGIYHFPNVFTEVGLNYETRINQMTERNLDTSMSSIFHNTKMEMLNIPVNIGVRFSTHWGFPYVQFGAYYSRFIDGYYYTNTIQNNQSQREEINNSAFNKNIVGGQFYIGYETNSFKNFSLDASIRLARDFTYYTNDTYPNYDFRFISYALALRLKYKL